MRTSGAARLRLVCKFTAPSTGPGKLRRNGEPCVRQNRVVLAVVATVKPLRRRHLRQPARCRCISRRRGRPKGTRLPGEHGISRPTIAQGRPSDWLHLYAAVRFSCVCFSRSGPRVPAGTRPSLRPLGQEGEATKQSSGEMRRENERPCPLSERSLDHVAACNRSLSLSKAGYDEAGLDAIWSE